MKTEGTNRTPRPRRLLLPAGLALALCSVAAAQAPTLHERLEDLRLELVTGAPTPELRRSVAALAAEAQAAAEGGGEAEAETLALVQALQREVEPRQVPARGDATIGTDQAAVVEALRRSLERGDRSLVTKLGSRAAPALEAVVRATGGGPRPEGEIDPLRELAMYHEAPRALDLAHELLLSPSFLVKNNALRQADAAWSKNDVYARLADGRWTLAHPAWSEIPARALAEPALDPEALGPTLDALIAVGEVPEGVGDLALPRLPRERWWLRHEGNLWLYRRALTSEDASVRRAGVEALLQLGRFDDVATLADDPAPEVRRALGQRLLEGFAWTPHRPDLFHGSGEQTATYPRLDDARLAVVLRLLSDPVPEVADRVWDAVLRRCGEDKGAPLSAEHFRALVASVPPARLGQTVMLGPDARQGADLGVVLERAAAAEFPDDARSAALSAVLWALDTAAVHSPGEVWSVATELARTGAASPKLLDALARKLRDLVEKGAIAHGPMVPWLEAFGTVERFQLTQVDQGGDQTPSRWLEPLGASDRRRLIEAYCRAWRARVAATAEDGERPPFLFDRPRKVAGALLDDAVELAHLALSEELPPRCRVWAFWRLEGAEGGGLHPDHVEPLARTLAAVEDPGDAAGLAWFVSGGLRDALALALLGLPAADDALIRGLGVPLEGPSPNLLERGLERFPSTAWGPNEHSPFVYGLLSGLVRDSADDLDPRLGAASFESHHLRLFAARRVAALRTPALFPVAVRLLRESTPGQDAWFAAVDAVAGYFTPEAAAALLEAAKGARDGKDRDHVMGALRQMTEWREAAAAWERGAQADARRRAAVEELVALLDDSAQPVAARAGALRGLGVLGAAEELPRIVRALAASEPELVEAARAALARLEAVEEGSGAKGR